MVFLRPRLSLPLLCFPVCPTYTILIYFKLHNHPPADLLADTSLTIILIRFYLWFPICSHDPKQNPFQEAKPTVMSLKIRFASHDSFPRSFVSYLYASFTGCCSLPYWEFNSHHWLFCIISDPFCHYHKV